MAKRLNAVFDEYDLVMTPVTAAPPPTAEISRTTGALRTFNQGSPYVCYTPTWNYIVQPAASVPAGFDPEGMPQAIQLAGPPNSEARIVSLAAQIEAAHHADGSDRLPSRAPTEHHRIQVGAKASCRATVDWDRRNRRAASTPEPSPQKASGGGGPAAPPRSATPAPEHGPTA
jgi:hypothetical protein